MSTLKLTDIKVSDTVMVDDGFDCMPAYSKHVVHNDGDGLYIKCNVGHHFLDGQLDFETGEYLVGITKVEKENA